jgi:electron-transferring-flavoprotein dehydrogenase
MYLTAHSGVRLPNLFMPKLMNNHGNYIGSLGNLTRWLGQQAEGLGVEIYPGFAAAEVLIDEAGHVLGVATGDMGISKNGEPNANYTRGMELRARYTVFAEGVRGNLTKQVIARFNLADGRDYQKYGLGIKELWQVRPENHVPGLVQHSMGWPLPNHSGGGSWLYHFDENLGPSASWCTSTTRTHPLALRRVQRFKTHP